MDFNKKKKVTKNKQLYRIHSKLNGMVQRKEEWINQKMDYGLPTFLCLIKYYIYFNCIK